MVRGSIPGIRPRWTAASVTPHRQRPPCLFILVPGLECHAKTPLSAVRRPLRVRHSRRARFGGGGWLPAGHDGTPARAR